jgi:transposase
MSIRYDDDHDSEWAALQAISGRLGMTAETLRKWVRQAEVDAGQASGVTTDAAREIRELAASAGSWSR